MIRRYVFCAPPHHEFRIGDAVIYGGESVELEEAHAIDPRLVPETESLEAESDTVEHPAENAETGEITPPGEALGVAVVDEGTAVQLPDPSTELTVEIDPTNEDDVEEEQEAGPPRPGRKQ